MDVAVDGRVEHRRISPTEKVKAYFALTKPRVIELLLVTTVPVMILAQNGIPNLWLVFATLIGGALSAGSAGADMRRGTDVRMRVDGERRRARRL